MNLPMSVCNSNSQDTIADITATNLELMGFCGSLVVYVLSLFNILIQGIYLE